MSDHLTEKHDNSIDPAHETCSYGKCTENEVCDDCLYEWIQGK